MTLNKVIVVLTFAVAIPTAALAQPSASAPADKTACCAADDGSTAAAAVLLPPVATAPARACCPAVVPDHSAHAMMAEAESGCCGNMKDGCDMPCCAGMRPER